MEPPARPPRAGLWLGLAALGIHLAAFVLPLMAGRSFLWLGGPFHQSVGSRDLWMVFSLATDQAAGFAFTLWLGSLVLRRAPDPRWSGLAAGMTGGAVWGILMALLAWFGMTFCIMGCTEPDPAVLAAAVVGSGVACGILFALACRAAAWREGRRRMEALGMDATPWRRRDLWATATSLAFAAWGPAMSLSGGWRGFSVQWAQAAAGTAVPALLVGAAVAWAASQVLLRSPAPAAEAARWAWLPGLLWAAVSLLASAGLLAEMDLWPSTAARVLVGTAGVALGCALGGRLAQARASSKNS